MDHLCPRECFSGAVCLVCFSRPDTELDTYIRPETADAGYGGVKKVDTMSPLMPSRSTLSLPCLGEGRSRRPRTSDLSATRSTPTVASQSLLSLPQSRNTSRDTSRTQPSGSTPQPTRSSRSLFRLVFSKVETHIKKSRSSPPSLRLPRTPSSTSMTSSTSSTLRPIDSAVDLSLPLPRSSKSSLRSYVV